MDCIGSKKTEISSSKKSVKTKKSKIIEIQKKIKKTRKEIYKLISKRNNPKITKKEVSSIDKTVRTKLSEIRKMKKIIKKSKLEIKIIKKKLISIHKSSISIKLPPPRKVNKNALKLIKQLTLVNKKFEKLKISVK